LGNQDSGHKKSQKKILYLDCFSGISGDMFLGALLDAGLSLKELQENLAGLNMPGYSLQAEKTSTYGISGTSLEVVPTGKTPPLRRLKDLEHLLENSSLSHSVLEKSNQAFRVLAEAEARIHGVTPEEVHFHEIGAVDTVVDLVGAMIALELMEIDFVVSSPVPQARGFVKIDHGDYPLPAPATAEILAWAAAPVYGTEVRGELVTPTGATLLKVLVDRFGELPSFSLQTVGYGAGKKDFGHPNLLRVWMGIEEKNHGYQETLNIIEANLDDLNPEICGHVMDKLLEAGALDVYYTPVQMKKNRPAVKVSVLSPPLSTDKLIQLLFNETSTLGCRVIESCKVMLSRHREEVNTPWGVVGVKAAYQGGELLHSSPEFEDCLAISRREGIPLKDIYRRVEYLYHQQVFNRGEKEKPAWS